MNEELEKIARQLANVLLICAPQFPPGSVGAKVVTIAKNFTQVIDNIKNNEEHHENKV